MEKYISQKIIPYLVAIPLLTGPSLRGNENPNLDPAWLWTAHESQTLYFSEKGSAVDHCAALLPFFSPGSPLANFDAPDMYPEDGWVLVHRDFDTAHSAPPFPFFTLYNKYRGIFRIMLYNAEAREGTYFLGELKFLDGKKFAKARAGLFTFSDGQPWRQTLESYDPETKLSAYSRMTAYSSWAVFDFPLVGYDPEIKQKDPILVFKLTSIEKQSINLKSAGSIQLQTALENGEEAHPGFTWSAGSVLDSARKGYAAYKTVDSFIQHEVLSPAGEQTHGREFWFQAVKAAAMRQTGGYAPIVAAMGAAIESFIGVAKKATQWEPMKFKGQFQFDSQGVILTSKDLWYHHFFLNSGSSQDLRAQRPLQDVDWGIFNFTRMPRGKETRVPYNRNNWQGEDVTWKLAEEPPLVVNPHSGMDLVSVRVAFERTASNGLDRIASGFMSIREAMEKGYTYEANRETVRGTGFIFELRFKPRNPTLYSDDEILVVKKIGWW